MQDQNTQRHHDDAPPDEIAYTRANIVSIADFFIENPQMLSLENKCTEAEYDVFDELLMAQGIGRSTRSAIIKCIQGERSMDAEYKPARWILGLSLAYFAEKSSGNFDACISAVDCWHAQRGFYGGLKELIKTNRKFVIGLVKNRILEFSRDPGKYIFTSERDRFLEFCERWEKNKDLLKIWEESGMDCFPYDFNKLSFAKILITDELAEFVEIVSSLKIPLPIYDMFYSVDIKNDQEIITQILKNAPICFDDTNMNCDSWNKELVAPIILDISLEHAIDLYGVTGAQKGDEDELSKYALLIASILQKRQDGFCIAYNYIKYLLKAAKKDPVSESFIYALGDAFKESAKATFLVNNNIYLNFPDDMKEITKTFFQTGKLAKKQENSLLLQLRTQLHFFYDEDICKDYLEVFESILAFEDHGFYTYEQFPEKKHYDIALIYERYPDSPDAWKRTWNKLVAARHRIAFKPYGDMSLQINYNMNFLLAVGMGLFDGLLNRNRFPDAETICSYLWEACFDRLKRKNVGSGVFNEKFICLVIVRMFLLLKDQKRENAEDMKVVFEWLEYLLETPEVAVRSLCLLKNNGFQLHKYLAEEKNKTLVISLCKAAIECFKSDERKGALHKCAEALLTSCK